MERRAAANVIDRSFPFTGKRGPVNALCPVALAAAILPAFATRRGNSAVPQVIRRVDIPGGDLV
jgi:hypothetical protein